MKTIILMLACFAACAAGFAQETFKQVKPLHGQPGKTDLPTPNIPALRPDLQISAIGFISGRKNTAAGEYILTVSVTVRNAGAANAAASSIHLDFRRESTHGYYFAGAKNEASIPSIAGNGSISGNYTFRINLADLGGGTYSLPVKAIADWGNAIAESNEQNNASADLSITIAR